MNPDFVWFDGMLWTYEEFSRESCMVMAAKVMTLGILM